MPGLLRPRSSSSTCGKPPSIGGKRGFTGLVHFNLANVLFGRHELDAAIDGYQRALALRPNYADALQNLGTALTLRGRLADAVAAFRRLPNSPVVFLSIWYEPIGQQYADRRTTR